MTVVQNDSIRWRDVLWRLAIGGTVFFTVYGLCNELTARRSEVGSFYFAWEKHIPFLPWTIVPYWSIDFLYIIGFLLCTTRRQLQVYFCRLVCGVLLAATGFLLFPLRLSFDRPPTSGFFGKWFDALMAFDQPYNQAPSLHIIITLVVWQHFLHILPKRWHIIWHLWCLLIALSVLTTWQHHFIDLITGLGAGVVLLYLIPDLPWNSYAPKLSAPRWRIAAAYGTAMSLFLLGIIIIGGGAWWLVWPAFSCGLLTLAYARLGARIFQKHNKKQSFAASILFAPYKLAAWVAMRFQCRHLPPVSQVTQKVGLGYWPFAAQALPINSQIIDLCAEFNAAKGTVASIPMLDLAIPTEAQLSQAVRAIARATQKEEPILVHCALGLSRSALAVAAWLMHSGQAKNAAEAIAKVHQARPQIVLTEAHQQLLQNLAKDPA